MFLGFFAFSNYFLGFFSFEDINEGAHTADLGEAVGNIKPARKIDVNAEYAKLQAWKEEINKQHEANQKIRDELNQPPPERDATAEEAPVIPPTKPKQKEAKSTQRAMPPARATETPTKAAIVHEEADEEVYPTSKCHYNRDRDYEEQPITVEGRFQGRFEPCDIPCVGGGPGNADASTSRGGGCSKSIFFTMENQAPAPGSYDIVANTDLNSDVPLPYFNWVEYNFKNPIKPKTATAHVAAFISNCGPQKRLNWMQSMMKAGVKIDSYGNCMRNKEIPREYQQQYGHDYNAIKMAIVSTYKFTMSFENSGTKDYVTEKLFGVLAAGSVPLYDGAPNGKIFGPSEKSMLFADDFGTPEKMAEHILYLDGNDTAYNEYLSWKSYGPSDQFTYLMDIGNVHSSCRLCIRTADMHRKEVGPVRKVPPNVVSEEKTEWRIYSNTCALTWHVLDAQYLSARENDCRAEGEDRQVCAS
jgi:hypothetical protein